MGLSAGSLAIGFLAYAVDDRDLSDFGRTRGTLRAGARELANGSLLRGSLLLSEEKPLPHRGLLLLSGDADYVGMVRPADLRQALVSAQPQLEEAYRQLVLPALVRGASRAMRAGEVLAALLESFKRRPGGEGALHFLVSADWIRANVPGLNTAYVERAGPFDPLATYELLQKETPFVPITKSNKLHMVIDRLGVATEIARITVGRSLGRR